MELASGYTVRSSSTGNTQAAGTRARASGYSSCRFRVEATGQQACGTQCFGRIQLGVAEAEMEGERAMEKSGLIGDSTGERQGKPH